MTTIRDVNIRAVLNALRPGLEYHYKGAGDTGYTLEEAIGDIRTPDATLPTEAEIIAKWDEMQQA